MRDGVCNKQGTNKKCDGCEREGKTEEARKEMKERGKERKV